MINDQNLEIGQLVKVSRSLTVGDLYGAGHSQAGEVVIVAGEVGRVISPVIAEARDGSKLDRPWVVVRFFFTLPDHYRRDPTCEPVHNIKIGRLEAVTEAEAVILIMIGRYGKPWANTRQDRAAMASYMDQRPLYDDPGVLGNWRSAASILSEVAERVSLAAWGVHPAGETDLTVYMEAGDPGERVNCEGFVVDGDGGIVFDTVGGGPYLCESCNKSIRFLTCSGRAICEACLDAEIAEAEAVTGAGYITPNEAII